LLLKVVAEVGEGQDDDRQAWRNGAIGELDVDDGTVAADAPALPSGRNA
jgi:hypothetical protein